MKEEVIRQLERAASRIEKRWRMPSTEGVPLDMFFAFEPTRQECPDIEINGVMVNAMAPKPEIAAARLQAIAAVETVLRDRYGPDTEMNEWSDAPERTADDAAGVVRHAIAMIATQTEAEE